MFEQRARMGGLDVLICGLRVVSGRVRCTHEIVERFRRTLIDRPEVMACYTVTGEMDFLLHVIVRDIEALSDFTMRRLLRVPGVRDVTSSIVLETVKRSAVIPLEDLALE